MLNEFLLLTFSFRHCVILLNPTPRKMFCALLLFFFFFFPPHIYVSAVGTQWWIVWSALADPPKSSLRCVVPSLMSPQGYQRNKLTHISLGEHSTSRLPQPEVHWDLSLIFLSQALSWFHLSFIFLLPDLHILSIKSHKEREDHLQAKPCLSSTVLPLGSFPFSSTLG